MVLFTIDTWRRDATGFLGGLQPSPTPFLDGLAAGGLVAADAVAPVPLTGPSHWSMLTGRWPWRDGVRVNGDRPVGEPPTLATELRAAGWATGAFVSCAVLDHRFGFAAGFDHFNDRISVASGITDLEMPQRRGDLTVSLALRWLASQEESKRVFLWVHLFDPHFPYESLAGTREGDRGAYLSDVAFADSQARALMEGMQEIGRSLETTLWVVLSDHGEGLGDHGAASHGMLLHGPANRIPLFLAGAGITTGWRSSLTSTVDVMPTILEAVGLDLPEMDGRSLLTPGAEAERRVPLESLLGLRSFGLAPARGLRTDRWLWESSPADHLWDLEADPLEENDLASHRPDVLEEMNAAWNAMGVPEPGGASEVPNTLRRQLEALGYLSGGNVAAGRGDLREFVVKGEEWHAEVMGRQEEGDLEGAEEFARRFLEKYPNAPAMWIQAGFISAARGDFEEAEGRFRQATELDSTNTQARLNLANTLWMNGSLPEAVDDYRRVLERDPEDLFALYNLGAVLERMNEPEEAARIWRRFVRLYPDHPNAVQVQARLDEWEARGLI